jgi:hypothetical protein
MADGFNIRDFKANLNGAGVLPTNRFLVTVPLPRILSNAQSVRAGESVSFNDISRLFTFRAEAFKAPGVNIDTTAVNRYGIGPSQKMPFNAAFTDTSITFLGDRNGEIWNLFYNWVNSIFNFGGVESSNGSFTRPSYKARYLSDYAVDIGVSILDYAGQFSNEVIMHNAYPTSINDIPLSWNDNNQLMKITVGFTFRDWSIVDSAVQGNNPAALAKPSLPEASNPATQLGGNPIPAPVASKPAQMPMTDALGNPLGNGLDVNGNPMY